MDNEIWFEHRDD